MSAFNLTMSMPTSTLAKLWEWAWSATARLQGQHERGWEQRRFKLNPLAAYTWTYFLNYGEFDDHVTKAGYEWQAAGFTLASGTRLAWLLIHSRDPPGSMVAHGLTVKLSPCQCSDSSSAGRIAACLCRHSKCNLLLAQAHPRMIQHLSSYCERWIMLPLLQVHIWWEC